MKRSLLLSSAAMIAAFNQEAPMKLVNMQTGYVVVEFQRGNAQFHDRFLEAEMKETGILIPPSMSSQFEEKEVIFLGEPLFEKAFVEVYYPLCIAHSLYQWQN